MKTVMIKARNEHYHEIYTWWKVTISVSLFQQNKIKKTVECVLENKEFYANEYMNYRFGKKFKNVDKKAMIKQNQCIINFVKRT